MNRSPLWVSLLALVLATAATVIASCLPDPHALVGRPCDAEHGCVDAELVCCGGTCQMASEVTVCDGTGGPDGGGDGGTSDGGLGDGGTDGGGSGDGGTGDGGTGTDAGTSTDAGCPPNLITVGTFEQSAEVNSYSATGAGLLSRTTVRVRTGTGALQVQKDPSDSSSIFGAQLDPMVLATKLQQGPVYCVAAWMTRGNVTGEMRLLARIYGPGGSGDYDHSLDNVSDKQVLADDDWHLFLRDVSLNATYNYSLNFRTSVNTSVGAVYFVDDVRIWESPDGGCEARCAVSP